MDHLSRKGYELKTDTRQFLNGTILHLLNVLYSNGIDAHDCNFLGTNDIFVLRGSNVCVFVFSRSMQVTKPAFAEYPLSEIVPDENKLSLTERSYISIPSIQTSNIFKGFRSPIVIGFPIAYLTLPTEEREKAYEKVAELLQQPTFEDIERKKRIVRVNPIFHGRDFMIDEKFCFMLMPFQEPYNKIFDSLIKPTVESEGFAIAKSNDIYSTTSVIEDIWENINKANLVIAEISENNANVMYELGICHTVGKNVMMITQNPEKIPFNFRHMRCYPYTNDIAGSAELRKNIRSLLQHIKSTKR